MIEWKQHILDNWVITPALKYRYESRNPTRNVEEG